MSSTFNAKRFLKQVSTSPGVYQFYDANDQLLYVGKAKCLKKRLASYFSQKQANNPKTSLLVSRLSHINTIITQNEEEALLLENNLIKTYKPRYNIIFRDDKSYPYLYLSTHHTFPALSYYRGPRPKRGICFGPYPNAKAVRDTLNLMQKLFQIRSCNEHFFQNRTRPCLQYQLNRCPAPCVHYINQQDYYDIVVRPVAAYLKGDLKGLLDRLTTQMEDASKMQHYQLAARYRDQIMLLRRIQHQQSVDLQQGEVDVIGLECSHRQAFFVVLSIRSGRLIGMYPYHLKKPAKIPPVDLLSDFLPQYYLHHVHSKYIPTRILTTHKLPDANCIARVLSKSAGHPVTLSHKADNHNESEWMKMALRNAIEDGLYKQQVLLDQIAALQTTLHLSAIPERLACFDVSHTSGQSTVASCVLMTHQGLSKKDYRRFNIQGIQPADDCSAIHQAVSRYYQKLKTDNKEALPDLLIIDGGKGQLKAATSALEALQITDVTILGIAKGPTRKPGLEQLHLAGQTPFRLPTHSPALHLLQKIRDEAHRFAISGHRLRFKRTTMTSSLAAIPGIGPQRRKQLLKYFGGLQGLQQANIDTLKQVPGISERLAELIYQHFQNNQ